MSAEATPLSDLLGILVEDLRPAALSRFHAEFVEASLGVSLSGAPRVGGVYRVGPEDRITVAPVVTPDGRRMLKACADPKVFARRYDYPINAEMTGRTLLETVLKLPDLDGVLVCSAASFHSLPISREEAPRLLELRKAGTAWWKFW